MDTAGARALAARIRAGVRVGTTIELLSDGTQGSPLRPGDCGIVHDLKEDGHLVVLWDRGFTAEIHPSLAAYRPLRLGTAETP
jgi:hypothetical protein